jgi:hypothetical protein
MTHVPWLSGADSISSDISQLSTGVHPNFAQTVLHKGIAILKRRGPL